MPSARPSSGVVVGDPAAPVPDDDGAGAVVALGDHALEVAVLDGVVLDLHREALLGGVERRPLRDGPRPEDAAPLEAQVVVEAGGGVLLDDEEERAERAARAEGLARGLGGALLPVALESSRAVFGTFGHQRAGDIVRAMRAISSRTISFGLVSIPVKIYSPKESSETISFRMLHDKTRARVKQQYIDTKTGEVVSRSDIVKGYEFAKDQYVIFTDEEIKSVEAEATSEIEITEFVPLPAVDPCCTTASTTSGPTKAATGPTCFSSKALQETGSIAVAQYAARGKEYLVILRPNEQGGLIMQQLRYPDEVRAFDDVPIKEGTEVKDAELQLALQLIKASAHEVFEAEKYTDTVKGKLQDAIQRKIEGQEVAIAPAEEPKARVIDLMEALKASLNLGGAEAEGGGGRKGTKAAAPESEAEKKGASTS